MGSHLELFLTAWAIHGFLQGFGWPSLSVILLKWYPKERLGQMWGLCTTAGNIGQTMAPLVLSTAVILYGWRAAFLFPAAFSFITAMSTWRLVQDSPESVGLHLTRETTVPLKAKNMAPQQSVFANFLVHVLPDVRIWSLCLGSGLIYVVLKGLANWSVVFIIEEKQFTKLEAASVATAFEFGGILGTNAACLMSDYLKGQRCLTCCLFIASAIPGLAFLWHVPARGASGSLWEAHTLSIGLAAATVVGFSCTGPNAVSGIAMQEMVNPKVRGTASGLQGFFGQLGASLSGYPLVLLQNVYGWEGVFLGLAGSATMAVCIFLGLSFVEIKHSTVHVANAQRRKQI